MIDASLRLRLLHRALFGPDDAADLVPLAPLTGVPEHPSGRVDPAIVERWRIATSRAEAVLDPEDVEYLRLRSAWNHNCQACLAGRVTGDGEVLIDEPMLEKIKVYEKNTDISPRRKSVLGLQDAFMMNRSTGITDELRSELEKHFTAEQIVAFTLKSVNFWGQKMGVCLDADSPPPLAAVAPLTAEGKRISDFYAYTERNLTQDVLHLGAATRS